ncbi:MAG: cupredoxin domain-containing protein [Phycisphaerales bacterium]|nr:cupredoxin domain-containing protein [Phycisphaerales bacterium]
MKSCMTVMGVVGVLAVAAGTARAQPVDVRMQGIQFSPADIEITPGMTVRWTNMDFLPHTATSESGPDVLVPDGFFRSPFLSTGQSFEFTFPDAGVFYYYCELHGLHMQGTITVRCPADLNGDGIVDFSDYLEFLNLYDAQDPRVDFNGDGLVDFADYLEFLNLYEAGC